MISPSRKPESVNKWCQNSVATAIMDLDTRHTDGGHRKGTDSFILESSHMRFHRGGGLSWVLNDKKREVRNKKVREIRGRRSTRVRGKRDTTH